MNPSLERPTLNASLLREQSRERARGLMQASGLVMTGACLALSAAAIAGVSTHQAALLTGIAAGTTYLAATRERSLQAMLDMKERFASAILHVRQMPQARRDAVLAGVAGAVGLAIAIHMMRAPAPVLEPQPVPINLPATMLTDMVRSEQGLQVAQGDFVVAKISLAGTDSLEVVRMLERDGYGVRESQGTAWVAATRTQLPRLEAAARDLDMPLLHVASGQAFFQDGNQPDQLKRDMARWVSRMTQGHHLVPGWLADSMSRWAGAREAGAPHP